MLMSGFGNPAAVKKSDLVSFDRSVGTRILNIDSISQHTIKRAICLDQRSSGHSQNLANGILTGFFGNRLVQSPNRVPQSFNENYVGKRVTLCLWLFRCRMRPMTDRIAKFMKPGQCRFFACDSLRLMLRAVSAFWVLATSSVRSPFFQNRHRSHEAANR